MEFSEFSLKKDPACVLCGDAPTQRELIDYDGFCGVPTATPAAFGEISAAELAARRTRGERMLVLDVREADEREAACIAETAWIPLGEIEARADELAAWRDAPVVVHCHHGVRRARACALRATRGFLQLENLRGGIDAWSLSVDAGVPRY
jgi:adenylyltransferase/sulfurtransferase